MLYFTHNNLIAYVVSVSIFFLIAEQHHDNVLGPEHDRLLDSPGS